MYSFTNIIVGIIGIIGWLVLDTLMLVAIPIIGFLTVCLGLFTRDWCKEEWHTLIHVIYDGNKEIYEAIKYNFKG